MLSPPLGRLAGAKQQAEAAGSSKKESKKETTSAVHGRVNHADCLRTHACTCVGALYPAEPRCCFSVFVCVVIGKSAVWMEAETGTQGAVPETCGCAAAYASWAHFGICKG